MDAINKKTIEYAKKQAQPRLIKGFEDNENRIRETVCTMTLPECLRYLEFLRGVNQVEYAATAYIVAQIWDLDKK